MDTSLRNKILKHIKPSKQEHEKREKVVEKIIKVLEKSAKDLNYQCSFFIGGSFGKNTYLRTSSDVDIFARFSQKYDDDKISIYLNKILTHSKFDFKKQKGSRDYYSLEFKEKNFYLKVEVVPNRFINNIKDMLNSTDISPLHVEFLRNKAKKNKDVFDEIRLAKQFFKSKRLYGAESYINGFSGHVIDILIVNYGSLKNLIVDAKNWGNEHFLDVGGFYRDSSEALNRMDSSKLSSLVVVDPINPQRNAAKALSQENYFKFLIVAQNFDEFRENDFEIIKFDLMKTISGARKFAKMNNLKSYFFIFKLDLGEVSEDIAGSKLLKLSKKIESHFKSYDFETFKSDFFIDIKQNECLFSFLFERIELCSLKRVKGPFAYMSEAVLKFIEGKEYYFLMGDRIYSYEKRKYRIVDDLIEFDMKKLEKLLGGSLEFVSSFKIRRG